MTDVHSDWVEDLNVPCLLEAGPPFLRRSRSALITKIDSSHNVAEIFSHAIADAGGPGYVELRSFEPLGRGARVNMDDLQSLVGHRNYFTGFDTLWLFEEPPKEELPEGISLTSETPITEGRELPGLAEWMERTRCLIGLGDGYGLNYVTPHDDVVRDIEAALHDLSE